MIGFPEVGGMSFGGLASSFASFGFSIPLPAVDHVFSGFEFLGFILVTAIPFGVYDLVEAMDNVESAEAAGDSYNTTEAIVAEGSISLVGTLLGSPFANAVYIGHPGWKSMGGRIGYSAATGLFVLVLAWFGILAVFLNLVPVVAIAPILLYIGMLIGAQAFQTTPFEPCPGRRAGPGAASGRLGQGADRRGAGGGRGHRRCGPDRRGWRPTACSTTASPSSATAPS
jgi:adenine/guanine/hypoxanthine permease